MRMAKATPKDIDAAGDALGLLNTISSGYYPAAEGEEDPPLHFDQDDPAHLKRFYDRMAATLEAAPGWQNRIIGAMCFVILFDKNQFIDPDNPELELHPRLAAAALPDGVKVSEYLVEAGSPDAPAPIRVCLSRQRDGSELWAVRRVGYCLSIAGEWEDEPAPSSRDDAFLARCRFSTSAQAIAAAQAVAASQRQQCDSAAADQDSTPSGANA